MARAAGDWSHYAEFFPFVAASEAAVEGGLTVARLTIDPPGPLRRRLVAVADGEVSGAAPGRTWRLGWRSRPGAGTPTWGEWTIHEIAPGRSRVEIRLSGHWGLPATLERRTLARTLPWVLDGLAQQVRRCRYEEPRHPTCPEAPPFVAPSLASGRDQTP